MCGGGGTTAEIQVLVWRRHWWCGRMEWEVSDREKENETVLYESSINSWWWWQCWCGLGGGGVGVVLVAAVLVVKGKEIERKK